MVRYRITCFRRPAETHATYSTYVHGYLKVTSSSLTTGRFTATKIFSERRYSEGPTRFAALVGSPSYLAPRMVVLCSFTHPTAAGPVRTDKFEPLRLGEELHVRASPSVPPKPRPAKTKFLALDKCFPRRQLLAVKKETFHHLASSICFIRVVSIDDTLPYFGRQPPLLSNGEQSLVPSTHGSRHINDISQTMWKPGGLLKKNVNGLQRIR